MVNRAPWFALFRMELRVQLRSGLYAAYAVMTVAFAALLLFSPQEWRGRVFELIVLLDPSFLGFFFAGGFVLLERDQGVLPFVVTRGRGFRSWWWAKTLAVLTLAFTVITALVVLGTLIGGLHFSVPVLLQLAVALVLTVPLFLSLGVGMAALFPRLIDYFVFSSVLMAPVMFPLVELFGVIIGKLISDCKRETAEL